MVYSEREASSHRYIMTDLSDFRHRVNLTVRFADLDVLGHVNHAKYLTYMEQGRILYVQDVCSWAGNWNMLGMILAKASVDYQQPLTFAQELAVLTRCSRLGGKSFDLEYALVELTDGDLGAVVATGLTVMVAYDYQQNQTIPVPDDWREKILAYEPLL